MARRLQSGRREREELLENALEASAAERRRIASDLHDGVVQDLAGLSYSLSAGAERAADDPPARDILRRGAAGVRASIRRLRSMIVEIHPPDLHAEGLEAALEDLAGPLRDAGVGVEVVVPEGLALEPRVEELLYRGAREALRNVADHAGAGRVRVEVGAGPERAGSWWRTTAAASTRRSGRRGGPRGTSGWPSWASSPATWTASSPWGPARRRDAARAGGPGVIRVLIADDHGVVRAGLAQLIATFEGVEVVGAAEGAPRRRPSPPSARPTSC